MCNLGSRLYIGPQIIGGVRLDRVRLRGRNLITTGITDENGVQRSELSEALHNALQIDRCGFADFKAKIANGSKDIVPDKEFWLLLKNAFKNIGGREKPWGPVLASMFDRQLPYILVAGSNRLLDRVYVRWDGIREISAMRFERSQHSFAFAATMPRRDGESLLNITPRTMSKAVDYDLRHCKTRQSPLLVAPLLEHASKRISSSEILFRWGQGHKMPAQFRGRNAPQRLGPTGWSRAEIEAIMAKS